MPYYEREEKFKVLLKGLRKLGLEIKKGSRHMTATCPTTGKKTTIPRHSTIKKPTVKSIFEFLIENGYNEDDVKNAFKWKNL